MNYPQSARHQPHAQGINAPQSKTVWHSAKALLSVIMVVALTPNAFSGILDNTPEASNPLHSAKSTSTGSSAQDINVFPSVDQAFQVKWSYDGKVVRGAFTIAPGCYLYQDRFKLTLKLASPDAASPDAASPTLGNLELPAGQRLVDPYLGGVHTIYRDSVTISARMNPGTLHPKQGISINPSQIEIEAIWQGCAEAGLCYPIVRKTMHLNASSTQP